jgi:hypothetical protein
MLQAGKHRPSQHGKYDCASNQNFHLRERKPPGRRNGNSLHDENLCDSTGRGFGSACLGFHVARMRESAASWICDANHPCSELCESRGPAGSYVKAPGPARSAATCSGSPRPAGKLGVALNNRLKDGVDLLAILQHFPSACETRGNYERIARTERPRNS